jgi:hypothetical protein
MTDAQCRSHARKRRRTIHLSLLVMKGSEGAGPRHSTVGAVDDQWCRTVSEIWVVGVEVNVEMSAIFGLGYGLTPSPAAAAAAKVSNCPGRGRHHRSAVTVCSPSVARSRGTTIGAAADREPLPKVQSPFNGQT